jgi:hypothetical protein
MQRYPLDKPRQRAETTRQTLTPQRPVTSPQRGSPSQRPAWSPKPWPAAKPVAPKR